MSDGNGVAGDLAAELRGTFLFEACSDEQLQWLVAHTEVVSFERGEWPFRQDEAPDALWVLLTGEWRLNRNVEGREMVLETSAQPGVWAGWLPITDQRIALGAQILRPSRLLRIPPDAVRHMLAHGFPVAGHLISGIYGGVQHYTAMTRQQEKLAALGKLSAGLAHELNNPAAAARSAAATLRQVLRDQHSAALLLATSIADSRDAIAPLARQLDDLQRELIDIASTAHPLDPLARSDREDAITAWLDDHGVPDSYDVAGTFVDAGLDMPWLEGVAMRVPPEALRAVIRSLVVTAMGLTLVDEIEHSTARISTLVTAVKAYSYMDQTPLQDVDIHEGLENTLTILGHKLRDITVSRAYDRSLPRIGAYGSELNQVWTNLIDNAVDAMEGNGALTIETRRDRDKVVVGIRDNGTGIPPEIQPHIFEPFFTTKAVGQGTGLGLDTAYRIVINQHHGDISVTSVPGNTLFEVRLPIDAESPKRGDDGGDGRS